MHSTRRELLRSAAALGSTFVFSRALLACASDTLTEGEPMASSEEGLVTCSPASIGGNHGHVLSVPAADVSTAQAKTYSIQGTSGHDHSVTVSAAQFAQLGAGRPLTLASTNAAGHTHSVTITCTVAVSPPPAERGCRAGAQATSISANHGHSLSIPKVDVTAGVAKTYSIKGTSSHDHQVSIGAAQFAALQTGATLALTSSNVFSHVHNVIVACA